VLLNYNRRPADVHNVMTKVITRTSAIRLNRLRLGAGADFWHYWNGLEDFAALRAVNVLGRDMHAYYDDLDAARAYLDEPGVYEAMIGTGIVNHYAYKSRQDFLRRTARGTEGPFQNQVAFRQNYESGHVDWLMPRLNVVEDNVLRDLWAGVLARGREGAVVSFSALPERAGGPLIWSGVAAPDGGSGPVYFVFDTRLEEIAAALAASRKVVVVEPDVQAYYQLSERFADDIAAGWLVLENYLPAERGGDILLVAPVGGGRNYHVATIGWPELVAKHGAPAALYMTREVPGFPAPARLP
jgi:hypothetical protein